MVKGVIADPIGDLLARVRNAVLAGHREVYVPYSRFKEAVARVLEAEGYVSSLKKENGQLVLSLAYRRRHPVITGLKNLSKPGLRIYRKRSELPKSLGGAGTVIVSTSKGVMSGKDALKKGLGGEVLGEVW